MIKVSVSLTIFILLMAGCDKGSPYTSISDVSGEWLVTKNALTNANFSHKPQEIGIEYKIDSLYLSLTRFLGSPVAGLYKKHSLKEMEEAAGITTSIQGLKTAVQNNYTDAVFLMIPEIDSKLDILQRIETSLSDRSLNNFHQLFIFFSLLIITVIFVSGYLYSRLEKSENREKQTIAFSREAVIAQEQERQRIAQELHDTVLQDLLGMSLMTYSIGNVQAPEERKRICTDVSKLHRELIQRIKNLCDNLIPLDFQNLNFGDVFRNAAIKFQERTGVKCRLSIAKNFDNEKLDDTGTINNGNENTKHLHCFRITQECLTNIEKHAEASEVTVSVCTTEEGKLEITVSDNGRGFTPGFAKDDVHGFTPTVYRELRAQGHLGFWNMYERAVSLGGTLDIYSKPGKGTTITLRVPL